MAIPAVGADSLAVNYANLYNDPYFLQALNSPNYYQYAQNQVQPNLVSQYTTQADTTGVTIPADSVQLRGAGEQIEGGKKKSKGAAWILGTLLAAGTIFAGVKCHGKGAELADSLLGKIGKGAEAYWKEFSPKLSNFWDKCKFWENWGKK